MDSDANPLGGDTKGKTAQLYYKKCCKLYLVRHTINCLYYAGGILWGIENSYLPLCPTGNRVNSKSILLVVKRL